MPKGRTGEGYSREGTGENESLGKPFENLEETRLYNSAHFLICQQALSW